MQIVAAAAADADLLVLPEATLPAYVLGDDRIDDAAVESSISELRSIARNARCAVVAGAAIRYDGRLFNSAVVIDNDGSVRGRADKIFLWHFDRKWFAPGERIEPVDTSVGRLGVMICADGRMPGIASELADRGAEVLVMPTAWVTSGRDPSHLENLQADLLARVRAHENALPFVAANKCGTELGIVAYCGKSQIVDANGDVIAMASQEREETIVAELAIASGSNPRAMDAPSPSRRDVPTGVTRVAFSLQAPPADARAILDVLDANEWLHPDSPEVIPAAYARDPRLLPRYREAGFRRVVLRNDEPDQWLERIARARAAELRLYVFVFDRSQRRAYAVDPDGAVVAGTYDGLNVASCALDYERTAQTLVAPGTDIAEGLARVGTLQRGVTR